MKALVVILGILAAISGGVLALFLFGDALGLIVFLGVLAFSIYAVGWGSPNLLKGTMAAVLILFLGSTVYLGMQVSSLISAFTNTDGPADPADPAALASATGKIDGIDSDGGFRLEMTEEEIQAVIQNGLSDADSPLARILVDIVDGDPNGRMNFTGEFKSGNLKVQGSVQARLVAGAVQIELVKVDVGSLKLPGLAEGALEDLVESVADLNDVLERNRADVQSIVLADDRLVITGTQGGGDLLTSDDLLDALADQAANAGGGVEPPPERLGPGTVNSTSENGSVYYVALGDSLAANVGVSNARDGYVSRVHNQLEIRDGAEYGLRNFGISGETTGTLIRGGQLDDAIAFMQSNPVAYVTIDIGANDLLGHLGSDDCSDDLQNPACQQRMASAFATYEDNIAIILDRIKSAAPDATIVFMRAYNPFSLGFGGAVGLEVESNETLDAFNDIAAAAAAERNILVADAFTPMVGTTAVTTHMLDDPPDIHPIAIGFDVLAFAIIEALG